MVLVLGGGYRVVSCIQLERPLICIPREFI